MENPMKERVIARLAELGMRPSETSIRDQLAAAGLNPTYLYEFVAGKKKTISLKHLPVIAKILGLDPDALSGKVPASEGGQMRLVGVCEAGAWRNAGAFTPERIPFAPHPRYPSTDQVAFIVRDKHAENLGISEGSLAIILQHVEPRQGEVIVASRTRDDGAKETTIKKVGPETVGMIVEGVVILAIKTF